MGIEEGVSSWRVLGDNPTARLPRVSQEVGTLHHGVPTLTFIEAGSVCFGFTRLSSEVPWKKF